MAKPPAEQIEELKLQRTRCEQRAVEFEARARVAEEKLAALQKRADRQGHLLERHAQKNRYHIADALFRGTYKPLELPALFLKILRHFASGLKKHVFKP